MQCKFFSISKAMESLILKCSRPPSQGGYSREQLDIILQSVGEDPARFPNKEDICRYLAGQNLLGEMGTPMSEIPVVGSARILTPMELSRVQSHTQSRSSSSQSHMQMQSQMQSQ